MEPDMLLLLVILLLVFGGGAGYWGHNNFNGGWSGPGFGLGTILIILLLFYLFGGFRL